MSKSAHYIQVGRKAPKYRHRRWVPKSQNQWLSTSFGCMCFPQWASWVSRWNHGKWSKMMCRTDVADSRKGAISYRGGLLATQDIVSVTKFICSSASTFIHRRGRASWGIEIGRHWGLWTAWGALMMLPWCRYRHSCQYLWNEESWVFDLHRQNEVDEPRDTGQKEMIHDRTIRETAK